MTIKFGAKVIAITFVIMGINWAFPRLGEFSWLPFGFAVLSFLVAVSAVSIVVCIASMIQSVRNRRRGYTVWLTGQYSSQLMYREHDKGTLELYCEGYVPVPSEEEWQRRMPEWAKERRTEIMDRIVKELAHDKSIRFIGYSRSVVIKLRQ